MADHDQTRREAEQWLETQSDRSEGKRIMAALLSELEQADRKAQDGNDEVIRLHNQLVRLQKAAKPFNSTLTDVGENARFAINVTGRDILALRDALAADSDREAGSYSLNNPDLNEPGLR